MKEIFVKWCKENKSNSAIDFFKWLMENDYVIIKTNRFLDNGWDCDLSPTGYCNYEQEDGSYDEDCCRYCGEPEERK